LPYLQKYAVRIPSKRITRMAIAHATIIAPVARIIAAANALRGLLLLLIRP
jgi:hypothetical protein